MITNIKSINVFPSWCCCCVDDSNPYKAYELLLFWSYSFFFFFSNSLMLLPWVITESKYVCVIDINWFKLNLSSPGFQKFLQLIVRIFHLYLLSAQETIGNGYFSTKHCSSQWILLIMQMWFSHIGFEVSFAFKQTTDLTALIWSYKKWALFPKCSYKLNEYIHATGV